MVKRILHIVGDSEFGGGAIVILQLASAAKAKGYEVSILTTSSKLIEESSTRGIQPVQLDCIWRPIRPIKDIVGLWRLLRYLQSNRYDIVHTHTSKAGFVGRAAATLAKIPFVLHTVHGFSFHEQSKRLPVFIYSTLERIASRWCDKIVTVSEYHRDWALQLRIGDAEKLIAISNGISEDRAISSKTRNEIRKEFGISPEDVMLVSAGRLAHQKGLEYLVPAVKSLLTKGHHQLRVVLAGDGAMRPELEALIDFFGVTENFHLTGFRSDIPDILSAADIAVMPTEREGLSISLLEAMAAQKPIVTTTIGSNREVTQDGDCAELVEPKEIDALALALEKLMLDKHYATQLGEKARKRFLDKYTESKMISAYLKTYEVAA